MGRKARILYATSGTAPGLTREALQAVQVARALAPWYEVDILCPMLGRLGHVVDFHGARLLRVPLAGEGEEAAAAFARAMRRQLADGVYEVVHVRTPVEGEAALEMRKDGGYTLIHEPAPPSELMALAGSEALGRYAGAERRIASGSDVLVVHGPAAEGRAGRKATVIPPGVDTDTFAPLRVSSGRDVVVVLGGEAEPVEGVHLVGIGERWPGGWMPEQASDLALVLAGAAACLLVAPAGWDAGIDRTPEGILEALACGRPVVAPRLPEVTEILGEGFLYDPALPGDGARAVREALGAGARGAPDVRERYSASAMRARILALYASIVPPGGETPFVPSS